jgi:hypothetical protein
VRKAIGIRGRTSGRENRVRNLEEGQGHPGRTLARGLSESWWVRIGIISFGVFFTG